MIDFIFLDSIWKCLFTLTLSTTIIYAICIFGYSFIKKFTSKEKTKWFFNYHILFATSFLAVGSIVLTHIDPELVAGCFDHFATASNSFTITRILAGGYIFILGFMLLIDSLKIYFAIKKHATLSKIKNRLVNDILRNLTENLRIRKPIEIILNETATSPYVWGLFKHSIVVNPFLLKSVDKNQIRTILSHELMHIRGYDSAWLLLSHITKRIFFFNPLSYIFYLKHKLAVEMAADERAVEQCGVEPVILLKSILEIAEYCTKKHNHLLQVNASQEFAEIKERIQSMTAPQRKIIWVYPTFSAISLALSITVTAIQTKASFGMPRGRYESGEFMCSQVKHEKVIENWLRIESPPNKCEIK